ncbi:MAG: helix-turn-helix domain-containing protein, partial [Alphaproteobacteria bacterium]
SDIARLSQFFADKFSEANGLERKAVSEEALAKLKACNWRGNIRELENTMHRAVLMSAQNEIESDAVFIQSPNLSSVAADTPSPQSAPDPAGVSSASPQNSSGASSASVQNPGGIESMIGRTIADVERDMILNTLDHCLGNRTHAANILGISIRTLRNKLNQYKHDGVDVPAAGNAS